MEFATTAPPQKHHHTTTKTPPYHHHRNTTTPPPQKHHHTQKHHQYYSALQSTTPVTPVLLCSTKRMPWKEIAKLELLSGSTRTALLEPNRLKNREEPNRRGTDTNTNRFEVLFQFLETKRTQTNPNEPRDPCRLDVRCLLSRSQTFGNVVG